MRETWVRFLGWKDPLEKRKVTHSFHFHFHSLIIWICKLLTKKCQQRGKWKLFLPSSHPPSFHVLIEMEGSARVSSEHFLKLPGTPAYFPMLESVRLCPVARPLRGTGCGGFCSLWEVELNKDAVSWVCGPPLGRTAMVGQEMLVTSCLGSCSGPPWFHPCPITV